MDSGWAAVVGALIAAAVSLATVFVSRTEPRALKELKALNELIESSPKSSEARSDLERRRDEIAKRYAAEPASVEERAVPIMFTGGLGLVAVAFVVYLFGVADVRTAPTLIAVVVGTLGISLAILSLVLGASVILGYATPFVFSRARAKWRTWMLRRESRRSSPAASKDSLLVAEQVRPR